MKVDITPYLPAIEIEIEKLIAPPFKAHEVLSAFGAIGKLLESAEALETEEDYQDAWDLLTKHLIEKYDLFRKLDDLITFKGLKAPLEALDGPAIRAAWGFVGNSLCHLAAAKIG